MLFIKMVKEVKLYVPLTFLNFRKSQIAEREKKANLEMKINIYHLKDLWHPY